MLGTDDKVCVQEDDLILSRIKMSFLRDSFEAVVSLSVKSTDVLDTDMALLKFLVKEKKMKGLIICVDRDYNQMRKLVKSIDLSDDFLYYIDAVTLYTGKEVDSKSQNKVLFIESPSDLTSLDIAISEMIEKLECGFLLLDCLSSLKLYNNTKKLGVFLHDLSSKLRLSNIYGIILLVEEDSDSWLHSVIRAFCDKNIVIKKCREI